MSYTPSPTIRQMVGDASPAGPRADLESLFFERLRLKNGVFKTTGPRRLDDVNRALLTLLPRHRTLQVMDVAISSGVATLEWIRQLREERIDFEMTAGDAVLHAQMVTLGRAFTALVDRDGHPLQIDLGALTLPNASGSRWRNAGFRVTRLCLLLPLPWRKRDLPLVSPTLLEQAPEITLLEDNIATANPALTGRFDVVRAANILNRVYFDDSTLRTMLGNLRDRLAGDGLLAVCRTDEDGANHGTIFQRREEGPLAIVTKLGRGADVEPLAD